MIPSQRREPVSRTRFLIALSLSTLTALAVAAPLGIQALRADEPTVAVNDPVAGIDVGRNGDQLGTTSGRTLSTEPGPALGGIGSRPQAKGQSQTSKSEGADDAEPIDESIPDDSVLTNPEEPTSPTVPETTTTTGPTTTEPETTTTDPGQTTTTTEPETTTTDPGQTTTTTEPETTTTDPGQTTTTTEASGPSGGGEGTTTSEGGPGETPPSP